ncbi:hypothetical protein Golax_022591 [Gossypium laxum]|uniref:DUF7745 domain-containing protein n=1 Tax=Gossypium laxum TaxID=34288 RepID=A0A7J9B2D1_9ROSI|nr:hypothetical protein [Gossypium laxum]
MEFLGKVEDNAAIRVWSKKVQQEKGDSLVEGYALELWDFTRISVTQDGVQELKEIWNQWDNEIKQLFYSNYGDLPYLLSKVDLVPTVEEYTTLLRCLRIQVDKVYSKAANVPTFLKKLMCITGMNEQWVVVQIKQKGDNKCIPWKSLRDIILAHPDIKKRVDIFALSIYGLVVFPKAVGHVDEAVSDLFDRLDKGVTSVPAILAETFRSLNVEKVSYRVFSESYSPLKELAATPIRDDITEKKWMVILQSLQEYDVEWKAPWMLPDEILYQCGDFDWVLLLGIWGAVGYTPLLVLRQYRLRQFIPATHGLAQCEFCYKDDNYKRKIQEISNAWKRVHRMKRFTVGAMTTPEYYGWWRKRVNDNIPGSREDCVQCLEKHLQVAPSEMEIIKQDFEKRSSEWGKRIEQLEEERCVWD